MMHCCDNKEGVEGAQPPNVDMVAQISAPPPLLKGTSNATDIDYQYRIKDFQKFETVSKRSKTNIVKISPRLA